MRVKFIFLFAFVIVSSVNAGKILVFIPGYTDGQTMVSIRFGQLLADAGHQVSLLRHQYNPDVRQYQSKSAGIKEIRISVDNGTTYRRWIQDTTRSIFTDTSANLWTIMSYAFDGSQKFALDGCHRLLIDQKLINTLKGEHFDLAIVNDEDICGFGMVHVLDIPTYTCLTSGLLPDFLAWTNQVSSPASFVPNTLSQFGHRMSLGQRVQNLAAHALTPTVYRRTTINPANELFRKFYGSQFPDLETVMTNTPIILVNNDEFIDFPRPILHKIIYIGGFYANDDRPLPQDWEKIMDDSNDGVVLISFGSVIRGSEMPEKWKNAILKTCTKFPMYTFVWKYESDLDIPSNVTNLKLANWIPQERILAHPKMKAFVTEGGLNSVMESARHGVPMVIVPLFGDQMGNRWRAQNQGVAVGIDRRKFKSKKLVAALEKVLLNETYKSNADRLSKMIKSKPVKPAELAIGWIGFLLEYKSLADLQPASVHLSIFQYFLIDALILVLVITLMFAYITYRICSCYYWRCCETSFHDKRD